MTHRAASPDMAEENITHEELGIRSRVDPKLARESLVEWTPCQDDRLFSAVLSSEEREREALLMVFTEANEGFILKNICSRRALDERDIFDAVKAEELFKVSPILSLKAGALFAREAEEGQGELA